MWAYIFLISCLKVSWRLGYFWSFFCHRRNFFKSTKKLSQFGQDVRKYKLVSAGAENLKLI